MKIEYIIQENYKPNIGEMKVKIKFAYFPTRINKTTLVWLEKYVEIYEYTVVGTRPYLRVDHIEKNIYGWIVKEKQFYNG